jgi:trehalose utilization protein
MTNNHPDRVRRKSHPVISLDQPSADCTCEPIDLPDESLNPERVMLRDELDHPLQSALDALQPAHRATVLLCDLQGATYEEAARAEACPIGTIRSRLHRAHSAIRDFLARMDTPAPDPSASRRHSRRAFLAFGTAAAAGAAFPLLEGEAAHAAPAPLRVTIRASESGAGSAYPEGAGAALAHALRGLPGIEVSVAPDAHGASGPDADLLAATDVLVLCGRDAVDEAQAGAFAAKVRDGMGLIALHAAADGTVFRRLVGGDPGESASPSDEKTLMLEVTAPRHPIACGVTSFRVASAPAADRLGGAARPDLVVFGAERTADGGFARLGTVWRLGRGRVFYFQPGATEAPVFLQPEVRRILRNAVCWCAGRPAPEP